MSPTREPRRSEKVFPCLLDRLTDDEPSLTQESRDKQSLTPAQFRRAVLRDLNWLLNTTTHAGHELVRRDGTDKCWADFPEAHHSVLAFGIPDLCGRLHTDLELEQLAALLENAIRAFEPRLDPRSLRVRPVRAEGHDSQSNPALLNFEIDALLLMDPVPEHLRLQTAIDLETGHAALEEGESLR